MPGGFLRRVPIRTITLFLCMSLMLALPFAPGRAEGGVPLRELGRLPLGPEAISDAIAAPLDLSRFGVTGADVTVLLVSSGVDAGSLPSALRDRISHVGEASGDAAGYGTYAASALLQAAPSATILSVAAYHGGRLDRERLRGGLQYALDEAPAVDAVLFGLPPSEILDPITAAMTAGVWNRILELIAQRPFETTGSHALFGLPTDPDLLIRFVKDLPWEEREILTRYWRATIEWESVRKQVAALRDANVAVVAPAGDLGPAPQTVLGFATLPGVIGVGAADGDAIAPTSSAGPSIDGGVAPDLVAPAGLVGLLPEDSALAASLREKGLLDPALEPQWDAGEPGTDARARLASSVTSAAIVAAAVAGLAADGVTDVGQQGGALTAASVPIDGTAVWQQGAGLLRGMPDGAFASSRPLALGHADLGLEPASGTWTTTVPFSGETPTEASTTLADFIGVEPDGTAAIAPAPSDGRSVGATVTNGGVALSTPLDGGEYRGGVYCGYTEVRIPFSGSSADPSVTIDGVPADTEQVPTCLIEGTIVRAFGFYIHDLPAEHLTIGFLPSTPVGFNPLSHALTLVPATPVGAGLFMQETGPDGFADFTNIPPGFYAIRQWSDYGTPVVHQVTDTATGQPVSIERDLGEHIGYQDLHALVLSPPCPRDVRELLAPENDPCTEEYLKEKLGEENVKPERSGGFTISHPAFGSGIRAIFDCVMWMPGPSIASRYVDLMGFDDLERFSTGFGGSIGGGTAQQLDSGSTLDAWKFSPSGRDGLTASYDPLVGATHVAEWPIGVASYPFSLTQPNYRALLSLNFSYELRNALIAVIVVAGRGRQLAIIGPDGVVLTPSSVSDVAGSQAVEIDGTDATGTSGRRQASIQFDLGTRGAPDGTIWMLFIPPVQAQAISEVHMDDLSFELSTWISGRWPARVFGPPEYDVTRNGHSFSVTPNFSARQLGPTPLCRDVDSGAASARVCEDWTLMVHTPGDDAAVFDVVDPVLGTSVVPELAAEGGRFFDPGRGVFEFMQTYAFDAEAGPLGVDIEIENCLAVNGEFWEQLAVPRGVLEDHEQIEVRIVDNEPGRQSSVLPHSDGPVMLSPYVPFETEILAYGL